MIKELRRQTYNKLPTKQRHQIAQRSPVDRRNKPNRSATLQNYMKSISKSKSPGYTKSKHKSPTNYNSKLKSKDYTIPKFISSINKKILNLIFIINTPAQK